MLFGILISFSFWLASALQCQSDTNQPIDAWFAMKEPTGVSYVYYDANSPFAPSPLSLNNTVSGALASTLRQLWNSDTEYILLNDAPPVGKQNNATVGHTKGVWAWNSQEAFILTHSIPLFPKGPTLVPSYQGLGDNAYNFGQSLACFSLSVSTLNIMAKQMTLSVPNIYDKKTSVNTPRDLRNLANGLVSKQPVCNSTAVQTVGGVPIVFFSKSTQWNNELYSQCVAPTLKESLFTETWIRGSAVGPSCSGNYRVNDISLLVLPFNDTYKDTQDHSKWAVGPRSVCVADINRMTTQLKRGGGAFCFYNPNLANTLNKTILSTNTCSTRTPLLG